MKSANCNLSIHNFNKYQTVKNLKRKKPLKAFSSNYKINGKIIKFLVSSRPSAMRGKTISFGEAKIIFNVFNHFKIENSSFSENVVITLNSKATGAPRTSVPRIIKHGVKSPSKIRPNRKKEFNKLDGFDLGVVRRMMHRFYARGESLANIYFFSGKV